MLCHLLSHAQGGTIEDAARACRAEGFRVYRLGTDIGGGREVDRFALVRRMYNDACWRARAPEDGGWAIDFHGELDPETPSVWPMIERRLHPYFVEDLVRGENIETYKTIRPRRVPIAMGEILAPSGTSIG